MSPFSCELPTEAEVFLTLLINVFDQEVGASGRRRTVLPMEIMPRCASVSQSPLPPCSLHPGFLACTCIHAGSGVMPSSCAASGICRRHPLRGTSPHVPPFRARATDHRTSRLVWYFHVLRRFAALVSSQTAGSYTCSQQHEAETRFTASDDTTNCMRTSICGAMRKKNSHKVMRVDRHHHHDCVAK